MIPPVEGRLALDTRRGIYLIEHRDRPRWREIADMRQYVAQTFATVDVPA
jgi:thiamine phosphate synthase YjbQ (UPF0047 family)